MGDICVDCGIDTTPGKRGRRHTGGWEHYMVHSEVWTLAGMKKGFLCIGCLEKRIGRELCPRTSPTFPSMIRIIPGILLDFDLGSWPGLLADSVASL
jgi:hypothetical protein